MATCKECICYESCLDFAEMIGKNIVESITDGHYRCEFIKDRSRFVELPCKLGDTIYWNLLGKTVEDEIMSITIYKNVIRVSLGKGISFDIEDIGRMLFLSREEAERALKEREENG